MDQEIKKLLQNRIRDHLKEKDIPAAQAARDLGVDPRNFDRDLKSSSVTFERVLAMAYRLGVVVDLGDLREEAYRLTALSKVLDDELDKVIKDARKKRLSTIEQLRIVAGFLVAKMPEGHAPTSAEMEEINKLALLKVTSYQKAGDAISIVRERTLNGFRFYRPDDETKKDAFSVTRSVLHSFCQLYDEETFYYEVVAKMLSADPGKVADIITPRGEVVWENDRFGSAN
ncbi:MAG: hypothetical protein HY074_05500 [Deltaproteobacteria bacterium]|nr:hypothetical protein [Deltaproteobacteria bacterium]